MNVFTNNVAEKLFQQDDDLCGGPEEILLNVSYDYSSSLHGHNGYGTSCNQKISPMWLTKVSCSLVLTAWKPSFIEMRVLAPAFWFFKTCTKSHLVYWQAKGKMGQVAGSWDLNEYLVAQTLLYRPFIDEGFGEGELHIFHVHGFIGYSKQEG